jgi:endogenous inhibitor of DNA gyrase (YacG/DUF329 family)
MMCKLCGDRPVIDDWYPYCSEECEAMGLQLEQDNLTDTL